MTTKTLKRKKNKGEDSENLDVVPPRRNIRMSRVIQRLKTVRSKMEPAIHEEWLSLSGRVGGGS